MPHMLVIHPSVMHKRCRIRFQAGTLTSDLFSRLAVACSNTLVAIALINPQIDAKMSAISQS